MSNRLARASSPYLLQHQDNPVDWYEWSDEAFAEARRRDVPVFLSVGYAACHWCHVMAHESFEHEPTADYLNKHFVSIKVDREERPDIDSIYMEATQAMTGQGGWPMTCVLTPDAIPFFAGTYYPVEPRPGMPGLRQVLQAVVAAWTDRRDEVTRISADVASHLRQAHTIPAASGDDVGDAAVEALAATFDPQHAGFGGAPKFPPSMVCEFLLRRAARKGDERALSMAEQTLEAMARGGMYDQLGGGFARYSVDARWDVPHFEKMLYDNALLLRVYVHAFRQTGHPWAERVARQTADFMLRELRTTEGGFASALDADSDGREGIFYVWTPAQLHELLGEEHGAYAADLFGVRAPGNFEHGTSTLRLDEDPTDWDRFRRVVSRLLAARELRTRPARDDKVLAGWNGLVIAALAEASMILDVPRYQAAAVAAAQLLVAVHLDAAGQLHRVSKNGRAGAPAGVLEDYACVADAMLVLYGTTGEPRWFELVSGLVEQILQGFADGSGGFFDTAVDSERLLKRPQDPMDNVTPSGQAMTATVLTSLAAVTGEERYREAAQTLVAKLSGLAERVPRFAGQTLATAEALLDGPRQVAVIGPDGDPARADLVRAAYRLSHPGVVVAQGAEGAAAVPLLAYRTEVGGVPAAYVCHGFVCDLPVTHPDDLQTGRVQ